MVCRFARLPRSVVAPPRRNVDLASKNWLNTAPARLVMKRDGGKQIAVLGHRNRRHLQLRRAIEQLADAARAVQQRELGVQMEVDELSHLDKTLAVLGAECEV